MGSKMIIAGMATMPSRKESLKDALESLIPQVDTIYVYVNNVDTIADVYGEGIWWNEKVRLFCGKDCYGDLGDAGKFLMATDEMKPVKDAYYFSVDDDLIYPSDYCLYFISKINKWNSKKVIGIHGKRFRKTPVRSFYRDRENIEWFHNQKALQHDRPVHMLGTGLLAYPMGLVRLRISDLMKIPRNSADIHFAIRCQSQGIGMICAAHSAHHVVLSQKIDHNMDTIFAKTVNDDALQTERVNSQIWRYF